MGLMDFNLGDVGGVFKDLREAITGTKIKDELKILELLTKAESTLIAAKGRIISAEASSEHKVTSMWRPITMLVFVFIIFNNYIIAPYAILLFGVQVPTLDIPPNMWELLQYGLAGYVVGRSAEKAALNWNKKG